MSSSGWKVAAARSLRRSAFIIAATPLSPDRPRPTPTSTRLRRRPPTPSDAPPPDVTARDVATPPSGRGGSGRAVSVRWARVGACGVRLCGLHCVLRRVHCAVLQIVHAACGWEGLTPARRALHAALNRACSVLQLGVRSVA